MLIFWLIIETYISPFHQDENDNQPQFNITALTREVLENAPNGTFIADFDVIDIDEGIAAEANFYLTGVDSQRLVTSQSYKKT